MPIGGCRGWGWGLVSTRGCLDLSIVRGYQSGRGLVHPYYFVGGGWYPFEGGLVWVVVGIVGLV